MYNRQKVALSLLHEIGRPVSRSLFQMMMFQVSTKQKKSSYDFVPHPSGCYSFQLEADRLYLLKQGALRNSDLWECSTYPTDDMQISASDMEIIRRVSSIDNDDTEDEVRQNILLEYPFFAINCAGLETTMNQSELAIVLDARPVSDKERLYTIGYEGKTLERYICTLIARDVKCLIDVRRNAFSRKFGFSKSTLKTAVESVGIEYVHVPQLGIDSASRRKVKNEQDFQELMSEYQSTLHSKQDANLHVMSNLLTRHRRIALTCFEANSTDCHRRPLSSCLKNMCAIAVTVEHL